jgi:hypothetical protein
VLTVILFEEFIVIQEGQANPLSSQLKAGKMPQLFELVSWIAAVVAAVELTE